jgi:hypothetical protein
MGLVRVLDAATGEAVEVDDSEASRGLAEGRLRTGGPVAVRLRDGRVADFGDSDAAARFLRESPDALGIDTPEYEEQRRLQREYGDRGIAAGAAGAARGATLGLSDVAGEALGYDEELRRLQEYNPEASMAGEVVGAVAPALLSGGESLLARGAMAGAREASLGGRLLRGVTAPSRLLTGAAERAGELTTRALLGGEAGLGRRLLARGAGAAIEGAAEGIGGEAARMLSEDALGMEPDLAADAVIARLGMGGLLGGVGGGLLGGGFSLAGEALRGAGRAGRESLDVIRRGWASRTGTELEPGVAEMLSDGFGRTSALVSGADQDATRLFTALSPEGRRARQIVDEGAEATYGRGTRELGGALDDVFRRLDPVLEQATGSRKLDDVRRVIRGDAFPEQLAAAESALARVRSLAADFQGDAERFGLAGQYGQGAMPAARRMQDAADYAETRILQAMEAADPAERAAGVFAALDDLKRSVGTRVRRHVRERGAREAVEQLYERDLRAVLEDTSTWGDGIRGLQSETNSGWHRFLNWDGDFSRMLAREGDAVGFDRIRAHDSARLSSMLQGVGTAANDSREQIFNDWLRSVDELTGTIGRNYEMPPEAQAQLRELSTAVQRARGIYDDVGGRARVLNQWRELNGTSGGGGLAGALGGAAGGALALGGGAVAAPLAAAAAGLGALTNPARAARTLTALERLARQSDNTIGESIRGFLSAGRRAAQTATRRTRRAAIAGTSRALSDEYRQRSRALEQQTRDLMGTTQQVASRTAELTRDAPRVQQAMQASTARALSYLQRVRPRGRALAGELRPRTDSLPSRDEMERFVRIARAVEDPLSVLRDLESRTLTPEAVSAIREVYPALHARIVAQATEAIANAEREPSYQDRIQLGLLLGIPTDPSLTPEMLATIQAAHAAAFAPQPNSAAPTQQKAPDLAGALASGTQQLEARRST